MVQSIMKCQSNTKLTARSIDRVKEQNSSPKTNGGELPLLLLLLTTDKLSGRRHINGLATVLCTAAARPVVVHP